MVARYGMSDPLGAVTYDRDSRTFLTGPDLPSPQGVKDYSEQTAASIDVEVRGLVTKAMDRAVEILRSKRDSLERAARRLLEKETIDEQELVALVGPPVAPAVPVTAA